jgi:Effector-associated domain 7
MNEHDLGRLREVLLTEFNEDELASLCQDAGLNYAKLPGMGVFGKTREIIAAAQTRHAIHLLLARVRELRPEAFSSTGGFTSQPSTPPPAPVTPSVPIEPIQLSSIEFPPAPGEKTAGLRRHIWGFVVIFGIIVVLIAAILAATVMQIPVASFTFVAASVTAQPPHVVTVSPTTRVLAAVASATDAATAVQAATAVPPTQATPSPVAAATSTPAQVATSTSTAAPTPIPSVAATTPFSQTDPAVQAIVTANEQLIDYYSGKISADALQSSWSNETSQAVISHAAKVMKKQLGIDLAPGIALQVSMKYVLPPTITLQADSRVQLNTREYWSYTHPTQNRTACETIDYHYTLSGSDGSYRVIGFKGDMVGAATDAACSN